jgi:hypothetical protein
MGISAKETSFQWNLGAFEAQLPRYPGKALLPT